MCVIKEAHSQYISHLPCIYFLTGTVALPWMCPPCVAAPQADAGQGGDPRPDPQPDPQPVAEVAPDRMPQPEIVPDLQPDLPGDEDIHLVN